MIYLSDFVFVKWTIHIPHMLDILYCILYIPGTLCHHSRHSEMSNVFFTLLHFYMLHVLCTFYAFLTFLKFCAFLDLLTFYAFLTSCAFLTFFMHLLHCWHILHILGFFDILYISFTFMTYFPCIHVHCFADIICTFYDFVTFPTYSVFSTISQNLWFIEFLTYTWMQLLALCFVSWALLTSTKGVRERVNTVIYIYYSVDSLPRSPFVDV